MLVQLGLGHLRASFQMIFSLFVRMSIGALVVIDVHAKAGSGDRPRGFITWDEEVEEGILQ